MSDAQEVSAVGCGLSPLVDGVGGGDPPRHRHGRREAVHRGSHASPQVTCLLQEMSRGYTSGWTAAVTLTDWIQT